MNRVSLLLIIHAHQPIGNFADVLERCYQQAYLPFLECLERHPAVCVTLHYSGGLLEWLEQHHPEYLARLRRLRDAGRIELLGGGFYEPILISIPEPDRLAQIARMQAYLGNHFGEKPRGAWLAERIWEPALPETLARAGVEYTLVDDTHFLSAGLDPEELYGYYGTESCGKWVGIIPGQKILRYLIPWRPVEETLEMLARIAETHPDSMVAMGDDLEKFGSWPQTYHSVYEEHWLEDFFSAVESNRSWLQCPRASDYMDWHKPLGCVYLPSASYREMTEWTLPPRAAALYQEAQEHLQGLERGEQYLRFLNGGIWRNFLHKYSEANLLHKQMLALSARFGDLKPTAPTELWEAAYRHLLAAQCNDAYWHGVFSGLYGPHLRHAVSSHLIQAETKLDQIEKPFRQTPVRWKQFDLTRKGSQELEIRSKRVNVLIHPSDGATVEAIHYKPASVNLVNSLRRRPEVYHKKVEQAPASELSRELKSIHDRVLVKEEGLERYLLYDRYDRHAFRNYFFPAGKTFQDFLGLQLKESPDWAGGDYPLAASQAAHWVFARSGVLQVDGSTLEISVQKRFQLERRRDCDRFGCLVQVECLRGEGRFQMGLEIILNLLAGHAPDRYYSMTGWKQPLDWQGELTQPGPVTLRDEWLQVSLELIVTPSCSRWWLSPIFSVSQSEAGFEKVYQGSCIMPVWDLDLTASASWEGSLELVLSGLR